MRKILLLSLLLISFVFTNAQDLTWFVSAHAGASDYRSAGMNGAVLAGFRNQEGQQLAFGPVAKNYMMNKKMTSLIGARIYSQMHLTGIIDLYIQGDITNGDSHSMVNMGSPIRLETGMGLNIMIKENLGIGCGYTFGEFNPLTNERRSSPSLKFIYNMPFSSNRW